MTFTLLRLVHLLSELLLQHLALINAPRALAVLLRMKLLLRLLPLASYSACRSAIEIGVVSSGAA